MAEPIFPGVDEFRTLRLRDLEREATPEIDWLWQGYLAGGNLTLLTSQWKTGKTTLLALLLDRLRQGAMAQADFERSAAQRERWELEASLDPRRRLVDLWRRADPKAKPNTKANSESDAETHSISDTGAIAVR